MSSSDCDIVGSLEVKAHFYDPEKAFTFVNIM
jgi:hypothetical protein